MTSEYRHFSVTVPSGTLDSAPLVTDLAMPARTVRLIRVRIPPGPNGNVGFRLGSSGVQVIPWNAGAWIIDNDRTLEYPVSGQIDSGAWQLFAYNTGDNAHTLQVEFQLDTLAIDSAAAMWSPVEITP